MFNSAVSHDLRSPVAAVLASITMLQEDAATCTMPLPASIISHLADIETSMQRMTALITDLLMLSRIKHATLRLKQVDLCQLALPLFEELARADPARTDNVTVIMPQKMMVVCDDGLFKSVLQVHSSTHTHAHGTTNKRTHSFREK